MSVAEIGGEGRPTTPFTGECGPESEAAARAVRRVLGDVLTSGGEGRKRARKASVTEDIEAAAVAVICEAAIDLLEHGGAGFRVTRAMAVLEQNRQSGHQYRARSINPRLPEVLDRLDELGFVKQSKGFIDRNTGKRFQTCIWPGPALETLVEEFGLTAEDFRTEAPGNEIVLRRDLEDGCKELVPFHETAAIRIMRREMETVNELLRAASIDLVPGVLPAFTDPKKRKMRRVFKYRPDVHPYPNAAFEEGGRLAGGFWLDSGVTGAMRLEGILIDGQPVAECDFGQSGLRVLYGIAGAGDRVPSGDLYSNVGHRSGPHVRDAVKKLVGSLTNVAAGDWTTLLKLLTMAETIVGKTAPGGDDRDTLLAATDAVRRKHPAVADYFPSEIGRRVQKVEADILVKSLLRLGHHGIVGLPVHDAVLVRWDRAEQAAEIMRNVFAEVAGAPAVVSIKMPSTVGRTS